MLSSYGLVMDEVEEVERPHINYTKNMSAWKKAGISYVESTRATHVHAVGRRRHRHTEASPHGG